MKRGAWHQLGWQHQKMIIEQLKNGAGVGVILSPRDLSFSKAKEYVSKYKEVGASIICDPQFHIPGFSNTQFEEYPTAEIRGSVSELKQISTAGFDELTEKLVAENTELQCDAIIAPAVMYEADRKDIVELNAHLHESAMNASKSINIPCYGTAFIGKSITNSMQLIDSTISSITSLNADGWYFAFEFPPERIPSETDYVYRLLRSALLFANTGVPVMHAYAGPLGILSFAAGCNAAATGPDQKQWRFCPERWEDSSGEGGGGATLPRYFSRNLWGTIIHPDEISILPLDIQENVITQSPYAPSPLPATWNNTDAKKHLHYTICKGIEDVSTHQGFKASKQASDGILKTAIELHAQINELHITLKNSTASYQTNWKAALDIFAQNHSEDIEFFELLNED